MIGALFGGSVFGRNVLKGNVFGRNVFGRDAVIGGILTNRILREGAGWKP